MGIGIYIGNSVGQSNRPYWTPRSLFFLDGSIITVGANKYFKDKSSNARNFLITGYDFDSTWTKGFPYKSAATISAPAGDAVLIAADINNFLYAGDGTPNQIPVVSLYQDIDYEHKIFCKHVAQVLDANDVETIQPHVLEIYMAKVVESGAGLTKANTYFGVPTVIPDSYYLKKTGNNANSGLSWELAVADMTTATAKAGATNTVYARTGIYIEAADLNFGEPWICVGLVEKMAITSMALASGLSVKGIIANGNGKARILNYSAGNYDKILLKNCTITMVQTIGIGDFSMTNSILIANGGEDNFVLTRKTVTFLNCLFSGSISDYGIKCDTTAGFIVTLKHCKFNAVSTRATKYEFYIGISSSYVINDNKFISPNRFSLVGFAAATLTGTFQFKNNYCNIPTLTQGYVVFIDDTRFDVDISNNNMITTSAISDACINAKAQNSAICDSNLILCNSTATGIIISYIQAGGSVSIKNNKVKLLGLGTPIIIGSEAVDVTSLSGIIIEKNVCYGSSYFNHSAINDSHGIFVARIAVKILRYNYINGLNIGIAHKGWNMDAAGSVFHHNLIVDNSNSISVKGMINSTLYNNTIVRTTSYDAIDHTFIGFYLLQNLPGSPSINTIFKNNIVADYGHAVTTGYCIYIIDGSEAGLVSDYNIFYTKSNKFVFLNGVEYTFAEWQALGYDAHSILLTDAQALTLFNDLENGDFSLKAGSAAIGVGEVLDAAYDDGLDTSTDWGADTALPIVVTKQQGAAWDIGAYVH